MENHMTEELTDKERIQRLEKQNRELAADVDALKRRVDAISNGVGDAVRKIDERLKKVEASEETPDQSPPDAA